TPTFAHRLRAAGYRSCLSGKVDFTGADQLHGFEERLTTDLSPSDFAWTPNWDEPKRLYDWFHSLQSVVEAGPCERSLTMDYDEHRVTGAHIRAARRAYYAMLGHADQQLGRLRRALEITGQAERTAILVTADHGDMLGERGLWYKMTFFERAVRVPLILYDP